MLDKYTNAEQYINIFSKYMYCGCKNKRIAMHSKRCWYCDLGIKLLESTKSVIASIINIPYDGLQNSTELSDFIK